VLDAFADELPFPLHAGSNDGIVSAWSQVYGRVLDVLVADHLDVVGQFRRPDDAYADWLPSGSAFDEAGFERAWDRVADHIAASQSSASEPPRLLHGVPR